MPFARLLTALTLTLGLSLLAGCVKVESGSVVTCKNCQKEVSHNVTETRVAFWNAGKYKLERQQGCCAACANTPVKVTTTYQCEKCGKEYKKVVSKVPLKNDPKDQTLAKGYCSKECETMRKVEKVVDKASETMGDMIGRILRGFLSGFKKQTD